jgi:AAA15 family ATPase/GTPase
MLSYIRLKNFKSFSNLTLDLRGARKKPKKTVFIYGENGSGKSNIMLAMLFLTDCLDTLYDSKTTHNVELAKLLAKMNATDEFAIQIPGMFKSLEERIADSKMLGTQDPMELTFGFFLDNSEGSYTIRFDEKQVIFEELRYLIGKREGVVFSISDSKKPNLSPSIFHDREYRKVLKENIERFWGKHTFMAILDDEIKNSNLEFMKSRIKKQLFSVFNFLDRLSVWYQGYRGETGTMAVPIPFLAKLGRGTIKDRNNSELISFERFLNTFFTQLYSDIKTAYYHITPYNDSYKYELYFKKLIDGRIIDIPLSIESTGTRKLVNILPVIFSALQGATVFIDEIDSGIHDLFMKNIVEQVSESCKGQLVITTHNTLLLEDCATDSVYIIDVDAQGNKSINCVADYEKRTQKTHNMRDKYLRGDYSGIPFVGDLDFEEMLEQLEEGLTKAEDALTQISGDRL